MTQQENLALQGRNSLKQFELQIAKRIYLPLFWDSDMPAFILKCESRDHLLLMRELFDHVIVAEVTTHREAQWIIDQVRSGHLKFIRRRQRHDKVRQAIRAAFYPARLDPLATQAQR
jgi:hypothetical protein